MFEKMKTSTQKVETNSALQVATGTQNKKLLNILALVVAVVAVITAATAIGIYVYMNETVIKKDADRILDSATLFKDNFSFNETTINGVEVKTVKDFDKMIMTSRIIRKDKVVCYLTIIQGEDKDQSVDIINTKVISSIKDISFLNTKAKSLCNNVETFWVQSYEKNNNMPVIYRSKRDLCLNASDIEQYNQIISKCIESNNYLRKYADDCIIALENQKNATTYYKNAFEMYMTSYEQLIVVVESLLNSSKDFEVYYNMSSNLIQELNSSLIINNNEYNLAITKLQNQFNESKQDYEKIIKKLEDLVKKISNLNGAEMCLIGIEKYIQPLIDEFRQIEKSIASIFKFTDVDKLIDSIKLPTINIPKYDFTKLFPIIDIKNLKLPNINLPKIELPKINLPNVNLPKFDLPNLDLSKFNIPKLNLPKIELPKIVLPKIELPKIEIPKIELPIIEIPKLNIPKIDLPKIDLPRLPKPPSFNLFG